jgi:hypothetical protein
MPPIGLGIHLSGQELGSECVLSAVAGACGSRAGVFYRGTSTDLDEADDAVRECSWKDRYNDYAVPLLTVPCGR